MSSMERFKKMRENIQKEAKECAMKDMKKAPTKTKSKSKK